MHERLKFKLQLDDVRGNDPDWGFQPVFSESQYGTHFVINARFEGVQSKNRTLKLENIHFYIQNYTGEVTVGLENFSLVEKCNLKERRYKVLLEPSYPESKVYKITLFARGFNNNFHHSRNIKGTIMEINPGDILVTEVIYLPITKKLTYWDDEGMFKKALYIDPIYQDRDGEDVNLTETGKFMILKMNNLGIGESNAGKYNFRSVKSFDVTGGVGAGRMCKASVSMMI